MIGKRSLDAENSLHILGCRGTERTCHHEDGSPRLDADTCRQAPATQRNSICLVWVFSYSIIHHLQGLCVFLILISIASNIHNLELSEYGMRLQLDAQCPCGFYPRHKP